jgi:ABC-type phosphate transport system substrate-binding protein
MRNLQIAAAVALALGAASGAHAAAATPAQCAAAADTLYVAGSSAAQPSFATALANDLFDSNGETTIAATGGNGNFKAYCGFAKAGNGASIPTGNIVTVYYRGEGGSVVGALPIASNHPIKMLDLSQASCQVAGPVVNGTSATVGTTDGWTGCVANHAVEMGVTDLEPTVFTPPNYPSLYSPAVFGSATKAQMGALTSTALFQQVFGLFVNTTGINGATTAGAAIDLSRQTAAAILEGAYKDWNQVPTAAGGVVSSTSQPITLVNREAGSGTRTGASIYFLGTNCSNSAGTLSDPSPANDGFATGDVLTTANATNGAITYASIDNDGSKPNLTLASLSGQKPTNLLATSGTYDWWFEATAQKGTITSPGGTQIYNWLVGGELTNIATAPHAADILAIPFAGTNTPAVPVTGTASTVGGKTIYVNPFTKSGNSCSVPVEDNAF